MLTFLPKNLVYDGCTMCTHWETELWTGAAKLTELLTVYFCVKWAECLPDMSERRPSFKNVALEDIGIAYSWCEGHKTKKSCKLWTFEKSVHEECGPPNHKDLLDLAG